MLFFFFLSKLAGRLFITDTNNSVIRYLDLNKAQLLTLELKGVQPPSKSWSLKRLRRRLSSDTRTVKVDGVSSNEGNLYLNISLPDGYHFSKVPLSLCPCFVCVYVHLFVSSFLNCSALLVQIKCRKQGVNTAWKLSQKMQW